MNKVLLIFTLFCAAMFAGCADDSDGNGVKPSLTASLKEAGETSASFSISIADAEEAAYLCIPASDETVSADKVFADGKVIKNLTVTNIEVKELQSSTSYKFFLAARNGNVSSILEVPFQTTDMGGVTVPEEAEVLDIKDGFLAYDGLDEASGYYRLDVVLCTKKIGDDTVNEYTDITLWVYCKYPLEISDNNPKLRVVPSGNITPFYTNGQGLTDMMYYIGKHVMNEDGPGTTGTCLYMYKPDGICDMYVADDTDNSKFEIKNNGDGTYTVTGVIADKTEGKSFFFSFTKEGEVHDLVWGQ